MMVTWVRQSGSEIELQDTENLNDMAKANGWKRKGVEKPAQEKPKRPRRTKAEMEAARAAGNG
jgi:hypothetical protein